MLPLSAAEIADMQAAQEGAMMDECYILRFTAGLLDEYNLPSNASYPADLTPTKCGLVFGGSRQAELMDATQAPETATMIRLPKSASLDHRDRIRVTKRFGATESSPTTYSIIGHPKKGPSGSMVVVELVNDGSG